MQILSQNLFPVVGVGASAGGMKAFQDLLRAIPKKSGMAYILIQHLAAEPESILTEILQRSTELPVLEITDNIEVKPDHIYVIPSNKVLTANDGVLQLGKREKDHKTNTIDVFFASLAEVHQEHSIGVILSGTGSDGTVGLKIIKDLGGVTIVQDEATASYYGMPQSALNAEVADFVLSPTEIPKRLLELAQNAKIAPSYFNSADEIKEEEIFRQILSLLKAKKGVDFSFYKQTTIRRRILRRKVINRIEKLKEYQNFLLENKTELDALFKAILIPVTAFFRDPETFDELCKTVFPMLLKDKASVDPVRIWVAGCSTGEEAYSIAICLHEYFNGQIPAGGIQIFATDISETSIAKARSGIFQKQDMVGVSEQRLMQYFTKVDGSYSVNKGIRSMVVFAVQNFLKDPPFAKIDLVSCRNVLIYMEPYLQKKAFSTFHYALNNGGVLLLGRSETPGYGSSDFNLFNQKNKIYTRNTGARRYMHVATERSEAAIKRQDDSTKITQGGKNELQRAADDAILSRYNKTGVIVNEQLDIVQFRGSTGSFLEAPSGKASHAILKMAREGLGFELRNALHQAKSGNEPVRKEGIPIAKSKRLVNIDVIPLQNTIEPHYLVLFEESLAEDAESSKSSTSGAAKGNEINSERQRIEQLEKELAQLREDMRTITEDQEAANEELQSANEELLSGSEELQSLNEELETSKEEIQSSNEELTILNQELIERNEQLVHSRKYAEAIITTIHEPLIILTKEFRIKSANRAFYEKFVVTEQQTVGKALFEVNNGQWEILGLREGLQKILPNHSYFEDFEVTVSLPYEAQRIMALNARQLVNENSNEQLILLAFKDITDHKEFEKRLESQVEERTRELKEANLKLQQANENLRQFASIASHDLQEPLRKIKTFTSILHKRFEEELPEEGRNYIQKIGNSADRMSQLIKDVLAYSQVLHSKKDFVPTNLHEILNSVLEDLELFISETGAVINYTTQLPTIQAIPLQMQQLFHNLLSNALKFKRDNIPPEISISLEEVTKEDLATLEDFNDRSPHIKIVIKDNGVGFEQKFAEQIFQIFERLHTSNDFEGTGVGLAICKKIIEHHHGYLFANSHEGLGAEFCMILPLEQ